MNKFNETTCINCESRSDSVFCKIGNDALRNISEAKTTNNYKRGHALFFQGNPPFGVFCIQSGKVKVSKSDFNGRETIVRIASPGDLVGHRSLFTDSPYSASAVVLEDAKVCFISKKTIFDLLEIEPKLALEFVFSLSHDLGRAENRVASLAKKCLRERFAELLILLGDSHGRATKEGILIDLKLTREEMASILGTANESLIRIIGEFKSNELIFQKGKTLYIKDQERLLSYTNIPY